MTMADPLLKAYAATILAKDASARYSNPRRALRNYNDIMEDAERGDLSNKEEMKMYAKQTITEAFKEHAEQQSGKKKVEEPKQKEPQYATKQDFYNISKLLTSLRNEFRNANKVEDPPK